MIRVIRLDMFRRAIKQVCLKLVWLHSVLCGSAGSSQLRWAGEGGVAVGLQHTAHSLIRSFTTTHECADISWDCHSWLFKHIIGLLSKACMDIDLVFR